MELKFFVSLNHLYLGLEYYSTVIKKYHHCRAPCKSSLSMILTLVSSTGYCFPFYILLLIVLTFIYCPYSSQNQSLCSSEEIINDTKIIIILSLNKFIDSYLGVYHIGLL